MLSATPRSRQTATLLAVLCLSGQEPPPRYSAGQLSCATFKESVRTRIRSQSGRVTREEEAGRDGMLLVQATGTDSGLLVQAWYDTVMVWRQAPEGRDTPDAEGLLGGRWQGMLAPNGTYRAQRSPFIPDEVAGIADLRGLLDDFFPVLPERALAPGKGESLAAGRTIRRVSGSDHGVARYEWSYSIRADTSAALADTVDLPMRRNSEERGTMEWDPARGPVRWERTITVHARIEASGPVKRPISSVVIQQIRVDRLPNRPGAC